MQILIIIQKERSFIFSFGLCFLIFLRASTKYQFHLWCSFPFQRWCTPHSAGGSHSNQSSPCLTDFWFYSIQGGSFLPFPSKTASKFTIFFDGLSILGVLAKVFANAIAGVCGGSENLGFGRCLDWWWMTFFNYNWFMKIIKSFLNFEGEEIIELQP